MGLKQDIVIVNQFTNQKHSGHGATPGLFLLKYINREQATESLVPNSQAQERLDQFVLRYMNRQSATEQAVKNFQPVGALADKLSQRNNLDGRAFGNLGVSYSTNELLGASQQIQDLWDQGHTVNKLVVSFRTDYLKEQGILPADFKLNQRGDFARHVDQLKLREALNNGMQQLTKTGKFTNPVWTGSVQVDTMQVHAHIVLADDCELLQSQRLITDGGVFAGEEKGKLSEPEKQSLRQYIHHDLVDLKELHSYHGQVDLDRKNVLVNLNELVSQQLTSNTKLQQIVASLPQDKQLWRYGSNNHLMQRPNQLMDNYLDNITMDQRQMLHYDDVLDSLQEYSRTKQETEKLPESSQMNFYQQGVSLLRERMGNQVYRSLAQQVQTDSLNVTSPYLQQQARDPVELRAEIKSAAQSHQSDPQLQLALFSYRLTGYQQRLVHHTTESERYNSTINSFDEQAKQGDVADDAYALRDHFLAERRYHMQATDKYRYFFRLQNNYTDQQLRPYQSQAHLLQSQRDDVVKLGYQVGAFDVDEFKDNQALQQNVTDFLHDESLEQVHELPGGYDENVRTHLQRWQQDSNYEIPDETVDVLNAVGSRIPAYQDLGTTLQNEVLVQQTVSEPEFEQAYRDYYQAVSDYSFDRFSAGMLRADQVIDPLPQNENLNVVLTGSTPEVPQVESQEKNLEPAYFDRVKGVDLHDLMYDLDPLSSRHVSHQAQHTYQESSASRDDAVSGAMDYLYETQQQNELLEQLALRIAQERQLALQVAETGELAFDDDLDLIDESSQRNLATIQPYMAEDLTRQQLREFEENNRQLSQQLLAEPEKELPELIEPEEVTEVEPKAEDEIREQP